MENWIVKNVINTNQNQPIREAKGATIRRDFAIQNDEKKKYSRLDIGVKVHKRKTCFLIDTSVPTYQSKNKMK